MIFYISQSPTDPEFPGDFTNLTDCMSYLVTNFNQNTGGLTEDVYLYLYDAEVYNEDIYLENGEGDYIFNNGFTIHFVNSLYYDYSRGVTYDNGDVVDISRGHPVINGSFKYSIGEYKIRLVGIVFHFISDENIIYNGSKIQFEFCCIMFKFIGGNLRWLTNSPTPVSVVIFNCLCVLYNETLTASTIDYVNMFNCTESSDTLVFVNNAVCISGNTSLGSGAASGLLLKGPWTCKNNTIQSYISSTIASAISSEGTDLDNVGADLGYKTIGNSNIIFIPTWNCNISSIYVLFTLTNLELKRGQLSLLYSAGSIQSYDLDLYTIIDWNGSTYYVGGSAWVEDVLNIGPYNNQNNFSPLITYTTITQNTSSGLVYINYKGDDPNTNLCSLTTNGSTIGYQYAVSPYSSWINMTPKTSDPSHSGVASLLFTPEGNFFTFVWDKPTNLAAYAGLVKIRLQAHDGTVASGWITSSAFSVIVPVSGWNQNIIGYSGAALNKVNGISVSNIQKITGV